MKKLFFLLLVLFATSFVVNAQDTAKVLPNITETERIIDKYSNEIVTSISKAFDNLKGPVSEVFDTLIRLQIAKGIINLLPLILFIITLIIFLKLYNKAEWTYGDPANDYAVFSMIVGTVSGILMFAALFTTPIAIKLLMAPEWYAIIELVDTVK